MSDHTVPSEPEGDWWLRRRPLPRLAGPFLYRNYRRRPRSSMNALMAMLAEMYRRRPDSSARFGLVTPVSKGVLRAPWHIARAVRERGPATRLQFGRSYPSQALDMWRAWWATNLPPSDYYSVLMARYQGGAEIREFLPILALDQIVIELQLGLFGSPPFQVNDKADFGTWLANRDLPHPRTLLLESGRVPEESDLDRLGDELVVKPRAAGLGQGVELWTRRAGEIWHWDGRLLDTSALAGWLSQRAAEEPPGIVVQEKLVNHPDLVEFCGETLSTLRVVTIRNEEDDPEVVQAMWRMPRQGSVVDNWEGGGIHWSIRDFDTGTIVHGATPQSRLSQVLLTDHPETGIPMIGRRHPRWRGGRELALALHRELPDVLLVGWDIATTSNGPMAIEMNVPVGSSPATFRAMGGIGRSRYGEILAWHARRWIEQNVPGGSRRRVC